MRSMFSLSLFGALCFGAGCSNSIRLQDQPFDSGVDTPSPVDVGTNLDSGDDSVTSAGGINQAPVADAGLDIEGVVPEEIVLDGSGSMDPDGDILNYTWELLEVPPDSAAFLINESRVDASFYADRAGTYIAELTVDDNDLSSTDQVEILVAAPNEGPVANAGPDQTVAVGDRVVLNGASSYDPDGDNLVFQWTMVSSPTGSAAALDDRNSAVPAFTADLAGAYVAELRVSDSVDISNVDQVRVIAQGAGGGTDGCLSCAAREAGRISSGNAAGALGMALLPLLVVWVRRRQR